jgi:hypothetical protein
LVFAQKLIGVFLDLQCLLFVWQVVVVVLVVDVLEDALLCLFDPVE